MPPRLVIFDFDGTLADSIPVLFEVMNEAADRFGFRRMTREDFERLRALPGRAIARELEVALWKAPALTAFVRRRAAEERARVRLFDGVPALLEALHARGVALAIVSTNAEATVRAVLGDRLAGLVAHYGCGASVFGKRPKLRAALRAAGAAPHDALSVGDELRDLDASRAEGIPFAAVTWGLASPAALRAAGPEHVVERVEQLLALA